MLNIPVVTRNLLIINVLVFVATYVFGVIGLDLDNLFGLFYIGSSSFGVWQFLTSMFMHGNIMHIATNMFMLWMFGDRGSSFFITLSVELEAVCFRNWHGIACLS